MLSPLQSNPSVVRVLSSGEGRAVGVKDTEILDWRDFRGLQEAGYVLHTIDRAAKGGRAIDLGLVNPITGRWMTGSSSGTAVNVFEGINDLGIGTDGGGSVLAPALALHLFGMISPTFHPEPSRIPVKTSTDGIPFRASMGFLTRDLRSLVQAVQAHVPTCAYKQEKIDTFQVALAPPPTHLQQPIAKRAEKRLIKSGANVHIHQLSYAGLDRAQMLSELRQINRDDTVLLTFEGPIDFFGYGDTMIGHYGGFAAGEQRRGHKYYLKVANMAGLAALAIPAPELAMGKLLLARADQIGLSRLFALAEALEEPADLMETYYRK